jgi:type IV secretion system protein VirD4
VSQNKPKFLDFNPASRSLSVSNTQRALLLPQEVINLPRDEQILLIESSPPIKSNKIKYYLDSFFKKRLLPPIPIPKQEPFDMEKLRAGFASNKDKGEKQANPQEAQKVITENPPQPNTADSKTDDGVFDS